MDKNAQLGDTSRLTIKIGEAVVKAHVSPRCGSKSIKNLLTMAAADSDYSSDFLNVWCPNPSGYKIDPPEHDVSGETRLKYMRASEQEYRSHFEDSDLPTLEITIFRDPTERFISAVNSIMNRIATWEDRCIKLSEGDREKAHYVNAAKKLIELFSIDRLCEFKQYEFNEYKHIRPFGQSDDDYEAIIDVLMYYYQAFILDKQTDWISVNDNMDIFRTDQINEKIKPILESLSNKILPECVSHETLHKECTELSQLQINSVEDYYQDDIKIYKTIK
jgi:hypothetical protein